MATQTPVFSFNLPTVGQDADVWGTLLNANWTLVESILTGSTTLTGLDLTGATIAATSLSTSGGFTSTGGALAASGGNMTLTGGAVSISGTSVSISTAGTLTLSGTIPSISVSGAVTCDSLTVSSEIKEGTNTLTGTAPLLDPANGTIQTWNLTGNSSISINLDNGESITLGATTGAFTINWPAIDWIGGNEPLLETSGRNWFTFWRVGGVTYGAFSGAST